MKKKKHASGLKHWQQENNVKMSRAQGNRLRKGKGEESLKTREKYSLEIWQYREKEERGGY